MSFQLWSQISTYIVTEEDTPNWLLNFRYQCRSSSSKSLFDVPMSYFLITCIMKCECYIQKSTTTTSPIHCSPLFWSFAGPVTEMELHIEDLVDMDQLMTSLDECTDVLQTGPGVKRSPISNTLSETTTRMSKRLTTQHGFSNDSKVSVMCNGVFPLILCWWFASVLTMFSFLCICSCSIESVTFWKSHIPLMLHKLAIVQRIFRPVT